MGVMVRVLVLLLAGIGAAQAGGEWRGGEDAFIADGPVAYAKGCYWHRGTRYCSSYCYLEVNGKHYCHERESQAVPQGRLYHQERPTVEEVYRQPRGTYR